MRCENNTMNCYILEFLSPSYLAFPFLLFFLCSRKADIFFVLQIRKCSERLSKVTKVFRLTRCGLTKNLGLLIPGQYLFSLIYVTSLKGGMH